MAVQRVFYVTQGSLSVWAPAAGDPDRVAVFSDDDAGLLEFDIFLGHVPEQTSAILIDVIEEEFSLDTIPKLGMRDRKALIDRRSQRKYRRTPFRVSVLHGKSEHGQDEFNVLHSAISNHELLDPWLQVILQHHTPLSGVHSVPLMSPRVFRKLFSPSAPALFVAPHQGTKLRQAFIKDGRLLSARLSQSPCPGESGYAQSIVNEAQRSRRYLERIRMLSNLEILEVCVVADAGTAERISELATGDSATQFTFIDLDSATQKITGRKPSCIDRFESVYLWSLLKRHPKQSYARSGENRYWIMRRMRQAIIAGSVSIAAACSVLAAFFLTDALLLKGRVTEIQSQVSQLTETFRREHEKFNPIQAGSHEMKLAVDTGDYILLNRLPVPWVMNQIGTVLGDYPDIQVRELEWLAESAARPNQPAPRRGERPLPVPIAAVSEVGALLTAHISPFDGDMRGAFARIDQLAADLREKTSFSRAIAVDYPLNAHPSAAVSGEIGATSEDFARFRIRVTYDVPGAAGMRDDDETT